MMNKNKSVRSIVNVVILVLIVSHALWLIGWLLMAGGAYLFTAKQPEPIIRYHEFPFQLIYELEGKKYVIEDSVICEYDGQEFSTGTGEKYRKWKSRLKSGNTRITLFNTSDGIEIFYLDLLTFPAGKYMGEPDSKGNILGTFPDALYTENFEDKTVGRYIISADIMFEKYKLRLENWEISPPIENSFE